ncbi:THUMP domain-containing protein [Dirofilaria immitis]
MLYCVTMGRGMEQFVKKQLEQIQDVKIDETVMEGKMLFDASNPNKLYNLRCVERLFLVVAYETINCNWNKRQLFDKLFSMFDRNSSVNSLCETAFNCLQCCGESAHGKTFRVSLKATGKWRRKIDIEKLSASIARNIKRMSNFNSSLHFAAIEICVHLSEKYIFIGIPITRKRLSQRRYLLNNALRSTVLDAMLSIANIQDGDVFLLGIDFCWDALQQSRRNVDYLRKNDNVEPSIDLLCMDLFSDCLKYAAVDHIISDIPFGARYGTDQSASQTLQRICDIFSNCSSGSNRYISTAILLISDVHLSSLSSMLKLPARLKQHYPISLGTTRAAIVLLAHDREQNDEK